MRVGQRGLLLAAGLWTAVVATHRDARGENGMPVDQKAQGDGQGDFDFLIGRWKVHNRRLTAPLAGSTSWYEFEGKSTVRSIWGGGANVDEYEGYSPSALIQGMTVRLYNPRSGQWSLYWGNRTNGVLDTPMIGGFKDGRGEFFDQEMFEGRSIYVRFIWSGITPNSCRWEQAFSADGGATWETNWVMEFTRVHEPVDETVQRSAASECCAVLELRQYALKPGRRDDLIELFDRQFVESQEAAGMTVVGQFRDRRRSDRFVWVRGFPDMKSRHAALEGFYGGTVWAAHRAAANDTMIDSDDVLLLKPARPGLAFRLVASDRPAPGETRKAAAVLAGIHTLPRPADAALVSRFEQQVMPGLRASGVNVVGVFVTESAPNTFTRLPVREGVQVLVWFGVVERPEAAAQEGRGAEWRERLGGVLGDLAGPSATVLELDPTPRSLLGRLPRGR
jgi:hypothetical protein